MPKKQYTISMPPTLSKQARAFQQQQSETQNQQNNFMRTLGQLTNGTNYTLSSNQVALGNRDLCVGVLALNCIQVHMDLQTATRRLVFEMARTIEEDPHYDRDKDGKKKEDNRALTSAFAQSCMDHQLLHKIADEMAEEFLSATGKSTSCIEITPRYIKKIALLFRAEGIPQDFCDSLTTKMNDEFLTCVDEAAGKAALLYLLFLLAIPVIVAGEEAIRRNWPGFKRGVSDCCTSVSNCPSNTWNAIKRLCSTDAHTNATATAHEPYEPEISAQSVNSMA